MTCKELKKYLPLYPDDVEPAIKEAIGLHLNRCESCRAVFESVKLYRTYALASPEVEAPDGLEADVIQNIGPAVKKARIMTLYRNAAITVSSAAAIILLVIIFRPFTKSWEDRAIEARFIPRSEKQGKGPAPVVDMEKTALVINELLKNSDARIVEKKENDLTGYFDYLVAAVRVENKDKFINNFNNISHSSLQAGKEDGNDAAMSYFKIYFDVINFSAGDFDGDHLAEIIVQFLSGMNKGEWVIYSCDDSSGFSSYHIPDFGKNVSRYLADYRLVTGDFNGDGLDDIGLIAHDAGSRIRNHILLNLGNYQFKEADEKLLTQIIPVHGKGKFHDLLAGDMNHDGKDELIFVSDLGGDHYEFKFSGSPSAPQVISIPDLYRCDGHLLAGDINGDQYADLCVKYIQGDRAGQTMVYLNSINGFTGEPFSRGLSFAGDYVFRLADCDGDGYDDLFVKSGGPFLSGEWYIMNNDKSSKFSLGKKFELKFTGD